ncbi:elongin-B isoform X1 [Meles meles]|uniref:elongin-B isoform X1 n=1 Tax=Meles meles TaxID=9662 RepID=UPI001E69E6C5|nr:elongin-B isoform X1 [Meles meles]
MWGYYTLATSVPNVPRHRADAASRPPPHCNRGWGWGSALPLPRWRQHLPRGTPAARPPGHGAEMAAGQQSGRAAGSRHLKWRRRRRRGRRARCTPGRGARHAGASRAGCRERGGARPRRRVEGAQTAAAMDVFLMIRRHKTTIFTDAKESSTVFELKRIVEGILKRPPDEQRLYKDDQLLDDGKTLGECGFTSQTARPQAPATVGLAFRAGGEVSGPRKLARTAPSSSLNPLVHQMKLSRLCASSPSPAHLSCPM